MVGNVDLGTGNDILKGGTGSDFIYGGKGSDKLWGGTDSDTFYFTENNVGTEQIKDFEDGQDSINLAFYGITNTTRFMNKAVSNVKGDVVIDMTKVGAKGQIIIEDAAGDIDETDFIF